MKKTIVSLISLLLISAMMLGVFTGFADTQADPTAEIPAEATLPEASAAPEAIADPETSAAPEVSLDPEMSAAPEASLDPEAGLDPEMSAEPEASLDPEASAEPEETIAAATPESSDAPEAAETPASVELPVQLEAPAAEEEGMTTSPVDNSTLLPDGEYVPESCTGGSGKVSFSCPKVTVKSGKAIATLVISSSKYDYVKASGSQYATAAYADGGVYAEIPVALNADNRIVGHTTAMGGKEIEYTIRIVLNESLPAETPAPSATPEPTAEPEQETDHDVETTGKMFKIVRSVLKQKDGKYSARITLSGTGYDKLYMGTAAQAAGDTANWISSSGSEEYTNDAGETKTGYVFEIPVSAVNEELPLAAHSAKNDEWLDRSVKFVVATPEPTAEPEQETEHSVETTGKMFKIVRSVLKQKDGKYSARITLSGTGYDKVYMGTAAQAAGDTANWINNLGSEEYTNDAGETKTGYVFEIPVSAVNEELPLAAHSAKNDEWLDRSVKFVVATPEPTAEPEQETEHSVETTGKMFKIVRSVLKQKDGKYSARITLSGTGYDKLYMGTAAQAAGDTANWINSLGSEEYTSDAGETKTGYVFEIPVSAVNEELPLAAHSAKNDEWLDRGVKFIVATAEPTPAPTATAEPSPTPTATPVIVATPSKVNSATSLADGSYTPDKFSWSGGSGRTSISCSKVTVKDGKAYATISFSSDSYPYVKASGSKYYGSIVGGRSTFEIPVKLNANNKIVGMTTAMSADHEIAYTIYIYIKGAEPTDEAAANNAEAEIIGLKYLSSDALENGKLFQIHRYEGGFIAIDVADVGKYLIVPEGAELPVGVDEEAILIRRPVQSVYAAAENALRAIDGLWQDRPAEECALKTVGIEGYAFENINVDALAYAGAYTAPEYAALLKAGCDLAIVPEAFMELQDRADIQERFDMLGIPLFVDRSAEEADTQAALEWIKAYGVLLDCEEAAQLYYEAAIAELEAAA